jgi:molecular chaperone GrpE
MTHGKETEEPGETLKKKVEQLQKERDEYLAGWQRAKADFINYKKEEGERQQLMAQFASLEIIQDLLVALSSFDLAISQHPADDPQTKGLKIIKEQVLTLLKRWGLEEMKVEPGEPFNPHFHEAVETSKDEGKTENTISAVLEKGYLLHGKVLKPAKVKVVTK